MKELERPPPGGSRPSDRASFRRAHASSADPNADADVESVASAVRYAFAVERSSEYASCDDSRSDFERMEWEGIGGGGRGRLNVEPRGSAVEA